MRTRLKNALNESAEKLRFALHKGRVPAYIHIPKTGGTYLAQLESRERAVIWPLKYLGHSVVVSNMSNDSRIYPPAVGFQSHRVVTKDILQRFFVVSTVRNPFDWLVSYYHHCGGLNPKYHDENHYDYHIARKGFDYLLKTIANRDRNTWPNRQFIHFQVFADDGSLIVNWLNRTATLDDDLAEMAKITGVSYQRKKPQRVGRTDDYRKYYSDQLVELVYETWGRELELFGFSFDGKKGGPSILDRHVTSEHCEKVKYFWKDDLLIVNEKGCAKVPATS